MAGRNRTSSSDSNHRIEGSVPRRILTSEEVRILDEHIAAQSRLIEAIQLENHQLATSNAALNQDIAASQQELRRLSVVAKATKAEKDAQLRDVNERYLKLEAEARSIKGLSTELDQVRAGIKQHKDERAKLSNKLKNIKGELSRCQPKLQELADLDAEIEVWQHEIGKGKAAIEHERKMSHNNSKLSKAMEKKKRTLAREAEKLRSQLGRRAAADVVEPANQAQPGYGPNRANSSEGSN